MPCQPHGSKFLIVSTAALLAAFSCRAGVIATWLFDEQTQVFRIRLDAAPDQISRGSRGGLETSRKRLFLNTGFSSGRAKSSDILFPGIIMLPLRSRSI
jgi:hypothetical protein